MRKYCHANIILLLLIIVLSTASCVKKVTEIEKVSGPVYWNKYTFEGYNVDNFITNAKVFDDKLYCSVNSGTRIITDFTIPSDWIYIYGVPAGLDAKPVISAEYTIFPQASTSSLNFSHNTDRGLQPGIFSLVAMGNDDARFSFSLFNYLDELGTINSLNTFTTCIDIRYREFSSTEAAFLQIKLFPEDDFVNCRDSTKIIHIPGVPENNKRVNVKHMIEYMGETYISYSHDFDSTAHIARISQEGEITVQSDAFGGNQRTALFYKYKGMLWAHNLGGWLHYSNDGTNWTYYVKMTPFFDGHCEAEDYLFGYSSDIIAAIGTELTAMQIFSFPCDDLKGKIISSVNYFQGNIVVTTNDGIYYKPLEDLIKDKTANRGITN